MAKIDYQEMLEDVVHERDGARKAAFLKESGLTHRQLRVLSLHSGMVDGEAWSFARIGEHYGVSASAVSKSYHSAMDKVRAWARTHA